MMVRLLLAAFLALVGALGTASAQDNCITLTPSRSEVLHRVGTDIADMTESTYDDPLGGIHVVDAAFSSKLLNTGTRLTFPGVGVGTVESATLTLQSISRPRCVTGGDRCDAAARETVPLRFDVNGEVSEAPFPDAAVSVYSLPVDSFQPVSDNVVVVTVPMVRYPQSTILKAYFGGTGAAFAPAAQLEVCLSETLVSPRDEVDEIAAALGVDRSLVLAIMALLGGGS